MRASRAVLRRVLADRAAVLIADAASELGSSESIMGGRILSTLAAPLWQGAQIRGVIQADNRASAGIFKERDLEMLMVLGAQATLAIDNALLVTRLRIAEERLRGENRYLKGREERRRFADIIGTAPSMNQVLAQLEKVIDTRATVCIEGRPARARSSSPPPSITSRAAATSCCGAELRRAAREPARERALWHNAGLLHRRRPRQEGLSSW